MKKIKLYIFLIFTVLFYLINSTEASINHGEFENGNGRYVAVDTPPHKMDDLGSNITCRFFFSKKYVFSEYTTSSYSYHNFSINFFCNRTQKDDKFLIDKKRNIVVQIRDQNYTLKNDGYEIVKNKGYVWKSGELSGHCLDSILQEVISNDTSYKISFIVPLINGNTYTFYPTISEISEFFKGLEAIE